MSHAKSVAAKVSIYKNGQVYVGTEARSRLGIDKNDEVRVTIPHDDGDVKVTGYINSGSTLNAGYSIVRTLVEGVTPEQSTKKVAEVEAIVEKGCRTWEDEHGLTENRFDGYDRLDCK